MLTMCHTQLSRTFVALALCFSLVGGCANNSLGLRYPAPETTIKLGHDTVSDVVTKMGSPFRRSIDSKGRKVLTYVWADGAAESRTCIIAFNIDGIAAILDVAK